uniref:Uncharacterized protein n=1 Tax=Vespula pensylvanica TaxID=30213 RepID=A0A834NXB6_VESPE|nr:hypothetical protein H0235_010434 [Vespula pensylvanica]
MYDKGNSGAILLTTPAISIEFEICRKIKKGVKEEGEEEEEEEEEVWGGRTVAGGGRVTGSDIFERKTTLLFSLLGLGQAW